MEINKKDYPLHDYYKDIYEKYDLVNSIFTFGRDRSWRSRAVEECLENSPGKILDVCTGTGDLILEIASREKGAENFTGYDFSNEMLKLAAEKAAKSKVKVDFIEGNVANMPFEDGFFDVVGISFGLRNLIYENTHAERHLAEIRRVITPGGRFVILESSKPGNPVWRFVNSIYLQLILPYLGGMISGNLKAYKYLARSSKNYYTKSAMEEILGTAGFKVVRSRALFLGSVMLVVAER